MPSPSSDRLVVWDLPLRLFHWGLMIAVIGNVVTAKMGRMDLHERAGLTVLALVAFRLIWGFIGGHHARFSNFIKSPVRVISWLRDKPSKDAPRQVGHSPLAALSVVALLAVTGFLATTGMFSTDGILFDGPLAHLVPGQANVFAKIHHMVEPALFFLVLLHLAAILIYKFRKKVPLTKAMVTGKAVEPANKAIGADGGITTSRLMAGLMLMAGLQIAAHLLPLLRPAWY